MTAKIMDGNAVARTIRDGCRQRVQRIVAQSGTPPGLAVILVGSDPASRIYVKNKIRACADVGIRSFRFDYPIDVKQDEVVAKIAELNDDPAVHGILRDLSAKAASSVTIAVFRPVDDDCAVRAGRFAHNSDRGYDISNRVFAPGEGAEPSVRRVHLFRFTFWRLHDLALQNAPQP
jgi:Tetrahydrofolate dehydrogenase/cyclohydrolase, catalytic domain